MTNQPHEETHEYVVFKSDQHFPCKSKSRETRHTMYQKWALPLWKTLFKTRYWIRMESSSLCLSPILIPSPRDNTQACNIRHPSACFFVVKAHHCNLEMDRSLHFTQCQLFFCTSLVMICKTNTLVQFTFAYAQHDLSAQPSWSDAAKLLILDASCREMPSTD